MPDEVRRFVVTGSGRSGTGFIAAALAAAGLRCGHEAVFGPRTREVPDFGPYDGDASWLAAPFLPQLPEGTVVLHQVREPVAVIGSWAGLRFLDRRGPYSFRRPTGPARLGYHEAKTRIARARGDRVFVARDYERFVRRHEPWVVAPEATLDRCIRYWIRWNELAEVAADLDHLRYHRYRVEDLAAEWPRIADLLGVDEAAGRAALAVPPDVNSRRRHDEVTVADLQAAPDLPRLEELARRYGYGAVAP